jgi:MoxR-like ATPase
MGMMKTEAPLDEKAIVAAAEKALADIATDQAARSPR